MWISKKQLAKLEQEKKEHGAKEYLRGATAAAEAHKAEQDELAFQKRMILDDWATLKQAKKELENDKALIAIDVLKSIFGGNR